jgi:signal transduction histidine kinase/CheY-like chemotaxis protein/HPt (histidine-containing phosphotransfer) domain-containing protein/PAS domain-containing protein
MGLLVPILNETDGRSPWGVLAMQIDPEARLYPYIRQWPTLSTTAETLLVRREGDKAVFLNELRFQKNTALKLRVSIDENRDLPAVKAAMGQEGIVEGVDYRGVAVIAAVRAVPDSPWFLVARMDTSEAYLPARDRLWATVAAVLFLTMGAGVGIGLAQRQQRMNYYRQKLAAAEDLAGERRNLKAIFDASPVGLLLMDDSALVTAVNDVASRLAGKTSAEMINRQPGEALGCIHASDDARGCGKGSCCPSCPIRAALEGVLRSGHAVRAVEVQPVLVIGGAKVSPWLEINAEPLTIDGRRHMIASVVNITGRKQAEQQLHEANSHLTQLNQELASAAARVKGLMDDVIKENVFTGRFANPNLTPCWEAKKCGNSACPSYQNRENLRCWEVAGTFCGGEVQGQFAKKFGTCTLCEVYKSARANPVLDLGETFNSMVAILKDRHEELEKAAFQLEQAIERANLMAAEAVQANAAKSEFLANMSHEIRTPMTAILGYTDLLSDPSISPSDRDNHVAVIRRNGEHLLELINDILDISKIESGKFVMDVQECSLPSLIADVISMMRVRTEQHSISLSVEYETEIPETVCTDGARVRQALVNLIGNAVKFTERGGVRVAASFLPAWRDGRPAVRVKVIDTGIGIGEEKLAQLFQPFVQADASTSRRYGGTGLGLAISRHFAELLGGELVAESTAGTGSTFTLTIPTGSMDGVRMLENPAEAVHSEAAGLSLPAIGEKFLAGIRVLLAEDGPDNQRLIRLILSTAGAEVELASDGHEAVSNASSGSYDVVLMDIQMPVMDGYEATRTLRLQGYAGPILALTAHAMTGDRDKCLASGCTDHLTKPIDRGRLIEAVARYAGKKIPGAGQAAPTPESPAGDPEIMRSQYANDPELAEVLAKFVAGLPAQVEDMSRVAQAGRREELQRLAHRLKGAGGSYGYPSLTEAARELEDAARAGDVEAAGMAIGRLTAMSRAIERGRVPESVSKEVKS